MAARKSKVSWIWVWTLVVASLIIGVGQYVIATYVIPQLNK